MNRRFAVTLVLVSGALAACATTTSEDGTLAELANVEADIDEVYLEDSLERAAQSYRRYLEETDGSAQTPEAMRRLADLQIEREYGVMGGGQPIELPAPRAAAEVVDTADDARVSGPADVAESEEEFERRATQREGLLSASAHPDLLLPGEDGQQIPTGPREALATYQKLLETYPDYERNDQVLYQLSRAYDEVGQPDDAMAVMDRIVAEYPFSRYVDEVYFRRAEYYFVRKKYLDAENAYGAIIDMGTTSSYFELALYKLGWALYKQEMYEEALHNYMSMLDYRQSIGYDFDKAHEEKEEHRVADTLRVVSLSFSNLGGPDVVDEYFSKYGNRSYADKIYANLGEFYFSKLRYEDAASIYKSFVRLKPYHRIAPHFGMRVVEIYKEAAFPKLVVEAKKTFATTYALDAKYWHYFNIDDSPDVVDLLKTNLTDLANHYHALYQDKYSVHQKPASFAEAQHWYREFLSSFPMAAESPQINYQLADLLLENENYGEAAREYERTAYGYADHEQASAAGYAAIYAYREDLKVATGARRLEVKKSTVRSSLQFVDAYQRHEQAPTVLGAAADDLYEMKDFTVAIASAQKLIERYPDADDTLLSSAWVVIAHSSIDLAEYQNAEHAYINVLAHTPEDAKSRPDIIDGLAAAVYKQGEQANLLEDYRSAANHFLRIKDVAATSNIRTAAEYDAAAALMKLQDWAMASGVLEEFRANYPDHELHAEATKQLAFVYHEDGQIERAAAEHERIAAEAGDPELSREALLTAGELYDEVDVLADAIRVYEQYVSEYPQPLDIALETRARLAEIFEAQLDYGQYDEQLNAIIVADRDAGDLRTDRSRYLAAGAALTLATRIYEQFAELKLVQPFEESLAAKQLSMDSTMDTFEALVEYEVAEVTAGATFYMAEIYLEFSEALMYSERPAGLSEAEKVDYELVIEEEAYPFEEQAIEVHEKNVELLVSGVYNEWVQKSLDELAVLMPGRYAKNEISGGFVGSIDTYAYRMPIVLQTEIDEEDGVVRSETENSDNSLKASAPMPRGTGVSPK